MSERVLWILLTVVGVLGTGVFGLALRRTKPDFEPPQTRFFWKETQTPQKAYCLLWLGMLLEGSLLLLVAGHNAAPWPWLEWAMMGLCAAAWLSGSAETLLVRGHARAACALGRVKWIALILWTAGLFLGLVTRGTAL